MFKLVVIPLFSSSQMTFVHTVIYLWSLLSFWIYMQVALQAQQRSNHLAISIGVKIDLKKIILRIFFNILVRSIIK